MKIQQIAKLGVFLAVVLLTQAAQAITVKIVPSATQFQVGGDFQVDLVVLGLNVLGPYPDNEIVSAFDLAIGFDNTVIQANSITIGGQTTPFGDSWLGDGSGDSIRGSDLNFDYANAQAGYTGPTFLQAVELSEASFLDALALQAGQPESFVLGSISFTAIALGSSDLDIIDDRLYAANGLLDVKGLDGAVALTTTLENSNVTVIAASIPEPTILGLLGLSSIGLMRFSRKRKVVQV